LGSNVAGLILALLSSVLINRALGPSGKGTYATLLTTAQLILLFATFGIGKSATFHLANGADDKHRVIANLLSMTALVIMASWVGVSLLGLISPMANHYTGAHLMCIGLLAAAQILQSAGTCILRGLKEFTACNLQNLIPSALFIALVVLAKTGVDLNPKLVITCRTLAILAVVPLIWLRLQALGFSVRPAFDRQLQKRMLSYGIGLSLYSIFQNLNYRFDQLLIVNLAGLAEAGWYSTATSLAEIAWYLPIAISTVLFPVAAAMKGEDSARMVCKVCRWSLWIMAMAVAALVILSPWMVPLLYGEEFRPTVSAINALAIGIVTNGFFQILGIHLAARKQLRTLTLITATGFVLNLVLNLIWIPRWGIIGAGLASTVSYSATGLITAWIFIKTSRQRWSELFCIPATEFRQLSARLLTKIGLQP
jgi:O-antigen/teichoic acid export membrane protein